MKKKVLISTIVSFVLLLAVIAAGINAVFTVSEVRAEFCVYSDEGKSESVVLKEKLDKFVGKSSTFLDLDDVKKTVEENPCFCVDALEKKYPTAVHVQVRERKETFACAVEGGFALFDEEGRYLYDKSENTNRLGGANVLLKDFAFSYSPRNVAQGRYAAELFQTFAVFGERLTEIRANVLSASLVILGSEDSARNHFFYIDMREGITIRIKNPAEYAKEKAEAVIEAYLSLSDAQRVSGELTVADDPNTGNIFVS